MKKFAITSFGCSRRDLDSARIRDYFESNGISFTANEEEADYLVIVSCGLTQLDSDNSIEAIEKFKMLKGQLIVYGCLPAMNPEKVSQAYDGKVITTKDINQIDELINLSNKFQNVDDANKVFSEVNKSYSPNKELDNRILYEKYSIKNDLITLKNKISLVKKTRNFFIYLFTNPSKLPPKIKAHFKYFLNAIVLGPKKIIHFALIIFKLVFDSLKRLISPFQKPYMEGIRGGIGFNSDNFTLRVSEGCLGNCSYCTIKYAIGKLESKSLKTIDYELDKAINQKLFNIDVISSDTGAYGFDIKSSLPELLNLILNKHPKLKIDFLQDVHPMWILRYKSELLKIVKSKRIKGILTAVQSGNEDVLRRMKRFVKLDEFAETINQMKKLNPKLKLRTQVIVGFPGETEAEFEDTIKFLKICKFDEVDVFGYYEVPLSEALKIEPKVPVEVIHQRANYLKNCIKTPVRMSLP